MVSRIAMFRISGFVAVLCALVKDFDCVKLHSYSDASKDSLNYAVHLYVVKENSVHVYFLLGKAYVTHKKKENLNSTPPVDVLLKFRYF